MSLEFMFTTRGAKGIGAKVEIDMSRMRPEDFTQLYVSFLHAGGGMRSSDFVTMFTLYPDQCDSGIYWHEALCPEGVRLTLVAPPKTNIKTLQSVKARLRERFDVVHIKTLRVNKWVKIPEKSFTY